MWVLRRRFCRFTDMVHEGAVASRDDCFARSILSPASRIRMGSQGSRLQFNVENRTEQSCVGDLHVDNNLELLGKLDAVFAVTSVMRYYVNGPAMGPGLWHTAI